MTTCLHNSAWSFMTLPPGPRGGKAKVIMTRPTMHESFCCRQEHFQVDVRVHRANECPAPQPMRRGSRPGSCRGWATSTCEPLPHMPCSFQPQERRRPPAKERGQGSEELRVEEEEVAAAAGAAVGSEIGGIKLAVRGEEGDTRARTHAHIHTLRCWWVWSGLHH